jgi:signal transduction histidine kinase/CheY-like chemotaxis protein
MVLLCAGCVLYIWSLILFQPINLYIAKQVGAAAWGPVFLTIGLAAAFVIQRYSVSWAATAAILGVAATIVFTMWLADVKAAPYMLAVVVSLTGTLFGLKTVIAVTALSSVTIIAVGSLRWGHAPFAAELLSPILVICTVGVLSSLGVRNLYTALYWALDRAMAAQRNEEEARAHRGELARTLKALTEAYQRLEYANYDLARAREVAEEASLNKQRFVAIVSHEMRTPLNVLTALSEMMYFSPERYSDAPLAPELRRDVREIYRSSKHLIRLIDDVLDMAQIEAGRMRVEFQPVELNDLVTETLDMIRPLVRGRGIALKAELPRDLPPVSIDRDRVQQVLLNLLNNAQRFTERGEITVRATLESEQVEVTVIDTGVGISPSEHEDMFKEFYQVEGLIAQDQGQGGHGLGLAICKRFIDMHGGSIWVESEGVPGQGSRFHFTLPVAGAERVKMSTLQKSRMPLRSPTGRGHPLLLLDQDTTILKMLERGLEKYQIVPVDDISQIGRLARELRARAVVVNSVYREQSERQILELRQALGDFYVPIITCPMVGKQQLGQALGAMDYLIKPVAREALVAVLDRLDERTHRVLVVDDDPQMAHLISRMLETSEREYEVVRAYNGREGLHEMRSQRPDLVLLDLVMPEMDGHDMLAQMQKDADLHGIPVVVITAQEHTPKEERRLSGKTLLLHAEAGFTNEETLTYLRGILDATRVL